MSISESIGAPPETALGAFWRNIRGARKRNEPDAPRDLLRRDRLNDRPLFHDRVAPSARPRLRITAERLMDSYFKSLAAGVHVYRDLKTAFDGLCEEAEIDAVTDKRFATWLQDRDAVRQRVRHENVTVYRIGLPPLKGAKRRGARGEAGKQARRRPGAQTKKKPVTHPSRVARGVNTGILGEL